MPIFTLNNKVNVPFHINGLHSKGYNPFAKVFKDIALEFLTSNQV